MKANRFSELDALRGFAALAVVISHYTGHAVRYFHDFPFHAYAGAHGVQLFFVISGFVIFWTLERSKTLLDFAWNRFSRLYPAYWAALGIWGVLSVAVFGHTLWVGGYVANFTMLQKFLGVSDIDNSFWTLAVELVWYVWMGAFFWLGKLQRMVVIGAGWLAVSAAYGIAGQWAALPDWLDHVVIPSEVPYFIAGTMFYLIWREGWQRQYVVMLICAFIAVGFARWWTGFAVAAVVFPIFGLAISGRLKWVVNPVTTWLGAISYSLYLTHTNLGHEVLNAFHDLGVMSAFSIPVTIAGALLLASLVTYGIEQPAMAVLRGWYRARGAKVSARPVLGPNAGVRQE